MILRKMKSIGRRHFKKILMKPDSAKACFGLGQGGLQEMNIPNPVSPPIKLNLVGVDFHHLGQGQKKRLEGGHFTQPVFSEFSHDAY